MTPTDDRTRRLSLRIDRDLKHRVTQEAETRGQSLTVFVERALTAALPRSEDPAPTIRPVRRSTTAGPTGQQDQPAGTPLPAFAPRRTFPH